MLMGNNNNLFCCMCEGMETLGKFIEAKMNSELISEGMLVYVCVMYACL